MKANSLTIEVYSATDPDAAIYEAELGEKRIQNLQFGTVFPGGLYSDASFFVPRNVLIHWRISGGQRVVFRNGRRIVYEGYVSEVNSVISGSESGMQVTCIGAWGWILMTRRSTKLWSDTRIDNTAWVADYTTDGDVSDMLLFEQSQRLMIASKKGETFAINDAGYFTYTAPAGQYIKRITYDYAFDEGALDSQIEIEEYPVAAAWSQIAATVIIAAGTGEFDVNTSANITAVRMKLTFLEAGAAAVDTAQAFIAKKMCVYSETDAVIDLPAMIADAAAALTTEINSSTIFVDAMGTTRTLIGTNSVAYGDANQPSSFGFFNNETWAEMILRACAFGDGLNQSWSAGLWHSENSPSYDGKPVFYCKQYPALTDYDYVVRVDDPALVNPISIRANYAAIKNFIIVRYYDDENRTKMITPDDTAGAALDDTISIAAYGTRNALLDVGYASSALAIGNGLRYLARYKDPTYELTSPITIMGTVRAKNGNIVPVSQIEAGKRIKIENWIDDLTGQATGATFLITVTNYDDNSETVSLTAGPPPDLILPVYVKEKPAEIQPPAPTKEPPKPTRGGTIKLH